MDREKTQGHTHTQKINVHTCTYTHTRYIHMNTYSPIHSPPGVALTCLSTRCCSWKCLRHPFMRRWRNPQITDWSKEIDESWHVIHVKTINTLPSNRNTASSTTNVSWWDKQVSSPLWKSRWSQCDLEMNLPQKSATRQFKLSLSSFQGLLLFLHVVTQSFHLSVRLLSGGYLNAFI